MAVHEGGAIEFSGHKVLAIPSEEGKISAKGVEAYLETFIVTSKEHMVFPGWFIFHPTEYGTLYTKEELNSLAKVCRQHEIPLFMDGARLGYGLMSENTDVTIEDVANIVTSFILVVLK